MAEKLGRNRSSAVRAFASIAAAFHAQRTEEDCELYVPMLVSTTDPRYTRNNTPRACIPVACPTASA